MNPRKQGLILVGGMLILAMLACTLPGTGGQVQFKTGPTQTQTISVPLPPDTSKPVDVNIRLAAAEVTVNPWSDILVYGTVQYNVPEFQPSVVATGNKVDITQGPSGGFPGTMPKDLVNKWNLWLGYQAPMNLNIQAGAYSGSWDLTGARLQSVMWNEGASNATIVINQANQEKMQSFNFTTGASTVKFVGLANLNFAKMTFQGGAGTYTFDFGGKLQRSAVADIKTGVSNVTVVVPSGTAARIVLKSAVSNIKTVGAWTNVGSTYTAGKYETATDKLDVNIDMGAGQLTLQAP